MSPQVPIQFDPFRDAWSTPEMDMNMDAPDPILLEMGAAYNQPEPAQMWPPGQLFLPGFVTTPPRSQGSSPPLVDTACSMQNGMAQEPFPVFYPTLNGMAQGSLPPLANVVHPMPNQIGQFPQPTILVAPPPSDRRKHACPYGGCGKRFSNTSHAKRHINKHCGMRATCPVCSKDFTRTDNLKAHTKKLHPEYVWPPSKGRGKAAATATATAVEASA